jgi:hypothetical protein
VFAEGVSGEKNEIGTRVHGGAELRFRFLGGSIRVGTRIIDLKQKLPSSALVYEFTA